MDLHDLVLPFINDFHYGLLMGRTLGFEESTDIVTVGTAVHEFANRAPSIVLLGTERVKRRYLIVRQTEHVGHGCSGLLAPRFTRSLALDSTLFGLLAESLEPVNLFFCQYSLYVGLDIFAEGVHLLPEFFPVDCSAIRQQGTHVDPSRLMDGANLFFLGVRQFQHGQCPLHSETLQADTARAVRPEALSAVRAAAL